MTRARVWQIICHWVVSPRVFGGMNIDLGISSDEIITCAEERSMMDGCSFRSNRADLIRPVGGAAAIASKLAAQCTNTTSSSSPGWINLKLQSSNLPPPAGRGLRQCHCHHLEKFNRTTSSSTTYGSKAILGWCTTQSNFRVVGVNIFLNLLCLRENAALFK